MPDYIIPGSTYEYLRVQAGYIPETRTRKQWETLYWAMQRMRFATFVHKLPPKRKNRPMRILDIGGGMCGIGFMFREHYGLDTKIHVIDGWSDLPKVVKHAQTFSSFGPMCEFYRANRQERPALATPYNFFWSYSRPYDVVVSFAAWCFHIPPNEYLGGDKPAVVGPIIVDMRVNKLKWVNDMELACDGPPEIVFEGTKYDRMVFQCSMS